ncbi:hypothetical protein ACFX1Q_000299 [Malus domestica]
MPSSLLGSSIRRNRISLKFFKTWVGEWWVTLDWLRLLLLAAKESGSSMKRAKYDPFEDRWLGPRNWPSACRGLTMPLKTRRTTTPSLSSPMNPPTQSFLSPATPPQPLSASANLSPAISRCEAIPHDKLEVAFQAVKL